MPRQSTGSTPSGWHQRHQPHRPDDHRRNADDAIDWNILKYIPDLEETLLAYAVELETLYDELNAMDDGLSSAPEISTLNVAAKQLRRVAKAPNKIGSKLAEFSEGSGSAYQLVGTAVAALLSQPLSVDQIYLYNGVDLPQPTGSFFTKVWHAILSFFYSFFDARYNDTDVDADTLEVWVGQSSLYLDIIQSMIDQDFTPVTGIKVKCSILSSGSKIVLSNATDDNPDVVLSIDDWTPYAYALRGMLTDLSQFPEFAEVAAAYVKNNFTPLIFEDGVYGIPETQSVFLLYYRTDILDYLDLEVPDTWDDVIAMLPILQSHQMNFFHPLGGDAAFKGYGFTTPVIYQMGGEIFAEDGIETTLKDPTTVAAIKFHDRPLHDLRPAAAGVELLRAFPVRRHADRHRCRRHVSAAQVRAPETFGAMGRHGHAGDGRRRRRHRRNAMARHTANARSCSPTPRCRAKAGN